MRLVISHSTTYHYDTPVPFGLQELRLHPRTRQGQTVLEWKVDLEGATREVEFHDEYGNLVELVSMDSGTTDTTVTASGVVETTDTAGIVAMNGGLAPLWLFKRSTELTTAGEHVRSLIRPITAGHEVAELHELSERIRGVVAYRTGSTGVASTAEDAVGAGQGVCQDHAHVFIAATRAMGFPARYVSGYLMMDDTVEQDATHAWAHVWIEGLGWVGFDVSNGISPDERYVEIASGLDYRSAAPISGVRTGAAAETLRVGLNIQQ